MGYDLINALRWSIVISLEKLEPIKINFFIAILEIWVIYYTALHIYIIPIN